MCMRRLLVNDDADTDLGNVCSVFILHHAPSCSTRDGDEGVSFLLFLRSGSSPCIPSAAQFGCLGHSIYQPCFLFADCVFTVKEW